MFVAGIVDAFVQSDRDWIVLPAVEHREVLDESCRGDLAHIAAAMLRVLDIELADAGQRYVVSRATACRVGLDGHLRLMVDFEDQPDEWSSRIPQPRRRSRCLAAGTSCLTAGP